jgi:hypothetical protein
MIARDSVRNNQVIIYAAYMFRASYETCLPTRRYTMSTAQPARPPVHIATH